MPLNLAFLPSQVFSRFYKLIFLRGYFQKIMSQQKRQVGHPMFL